MAYKHTNIQSVHKPKKSNAVSIATILLTPSQILHISQSCPSARVFYAFSHSSHNQFLAKRVKFGFTKVRTHTMLIIKSLHNHSSNSCFLIIPINIGLHYHSTWSLILLKN